MVPIQIATRDKLLNQDHNEIIHWFVYEPAYIDRWNDDSSSPPINPDLANNRKAKADRIISQGSSSYMDRINKIAVKLGVKVTKINTPQQFWRGLAAFPDNSISRVWYIGHASEEGLMLKLRHDSSCKASADIFGMVIPLDIHTNSNMIKNKIIKRSGKTSNY